MVTTVACPFDRRPMAVRVRTAAWAKAGYGGDWDGEADPDWRRRPRFMERSALATKGARAQVLEAWRSAPPLPHGLAADQHEAPLTKFARMVLARVAPMGKPTPRKPWFSEQTCL